MGIACNRAGYAGLCVPGSDRTGEADWEDDGGGYDKQGMSAAKIR